MCCRPLGVRGIQLEEALVRLLGLAGVCHLVVARFVVFGSGCIAYCQRVNSMDVMDMTAGARLLAVAVKVRA